MLLLNYLISLDILLKYWQDKVFLYCQIDPMILLFLVCTVKGIVFFGRSLILKHEDKKKQYCELRKEREMDDHWREAERKEQKKSRA